MNKAEDIFEKILRVLNTQTSVDFSLYKPNTIERRINKRLLISTYSTLDEYYEFLKDSPLEIESLKNDLLIGVTEFFRDHEIYTYLNTSVFPILTKQNETIRIWVAGCSTGEEAYSYAILLSNYIEKRKPNVDFKIFATDVSPTAVFFAGKGVYPASSLEKVSFSDKEKYFTLKEGFYAVKKSLREKIVFAQHNLIGDPPFINMHLISCRNLLIYLQSQVQQTVLEHFMFSLKVGGYLQLGNSESLGNLKPHFKPLNGNSKLYQCINKKKSRHVTFNKRDNTYIKTINNLAQEVVQQIKITPMNDFILQRVFKEFVPPLIITNLDYNILYIKGDLSKYLKIEPGVFQPNLLKMLTGEASIILKKALENLIETREPIALKGLIMQSNTTHNKVNLKLLSINEKEDEQQIAILFENESIITMPVKEMPIPKLDDFSKTRIEDLEKLLEEKTNENFFLEQELNAIKEKMQASNEELLASNEELQATNEELQSVNEELYSLNSEYQEKNTQLIELNNDVINLLNSTNIATMFLDKELCIRNFTPALQNHFKLQRKDIGRHFNSFSSNFSNHTIKEISEHAYLVLENNRSIEKEIADINGNTFLRKISPFTTTENTIEGIVLSLIDITQLKETQHKIELSELRYKKLIDMMPSAFAVHDIVKDERGNIVDYIIKGVNPMFEKLTGLKNADIINKNITSILPSLDHKWLAIYGKLADDQVPVHIIEYSEELGKYYEITGYSIRKGTFVTIFSDVTERIKKDNALKISEEKYRTLVDNALVGVYTTTLKGEFIYANHSFVNILGYESTNELFKLNVKNIYENKSDRQKIISTLNTVGDIRNFECKFIKKDGDIIYVLISAKKSGNNIKGMIIDITQRVKFQNELLYSQKRFKELINNSLDGYGRTDIHGNLLEANKSLCTMLGYSEFEILNKTYKDLTPQKWHSIEEGIITEQVLKRGYSDIYEKEYICSDGTIKPIELRTYLSEDAEGKPSEFWAFIHDTTVRKKREKLLEENRQRLSLALASAKQGLYDLNLKTGNAIVNDEYILMLGHDPKTFTETNKFWTERLHPDDKERVIKVFNDYVHGETKEYKVEFRQITKTGKYLWILSVGKIVEYDLDGSPLRMLGTHTDIDELKISQQKLAESRERFKLATQASNIGIWDWNLTNNNVYYSSTWKSQVGYDPEEIENSFETWQQLLHPDDYEIMHQNLMEYLSHPVKYFEAEFRMKHKRGHYVWIYNRASSVKDRNNKVVRMFGAHTDITSHKESQEKINTISQRLTVATRSAEIGIWELDLKTNNLYWDDEMFKIYGVSKDSFNANFNTWENALHPSDKENTLKAFNLALQGVSNFNTTFHIVKQNHEIRCIHAQAIITYANDGSPEKMIGVNWDITKDEDIKTELINAKEKAEVANVHKNNFLANMSHEIRTPMNGIIGFAELLKDDDTTSAQKDMYLHIINNNSQALLSLIDDIIDISKIEANEISIYKEPVNINELIIQLETEYNETKKSRNRTNVSFESNTDAKLNDVFIYTDKLRLRQILVNLLNNSLKFTEKGKIKFGYKLTNKNIEFYVNDDGIGIPKDKATEIFDRFYRLDTKDHRKYSGTGLGLAISKGLTNLLGGNIWVNPSIKKGASIHFTIPNKIINAHKTEVQKLNFNEQRNHLNGLTALLVEDQENIFTFFKEALDKTGMDIIWVENGEDAVEKYKEMSQNINIVLMDINLPGMNGIEATKHILKYDPAAIIIAQTAYAMHEELDSCLKAGCIDYITKPIKPAELIEKIKKYS